MAKNNPYRSYSRGTKSTPQSQPVPGRSDMSPNNAGGYAFTLDKWDTLRRFLILGTEGGTYYTSQQNLTKKSAENVIACIREDGTRAVDMIVEISDKGLAYKNSPAMFALALCATPEYASVGTRRYALGNLPKVVRTGSHMLEFVAMLRDMRSIGRAPKRAISNWYLDMSPAGLAYQVAKYQNRGGYTQRDVLRLVKPKPRNASTDAVLHWVTKNHSIENANPDAVPAILRTFNEAQRTDKAVDIARLIANNGLTREMIPTQFLNDDGVWAALLTGMPMTAMIRNLGKMSAVGLLKTNSSAASYVIDRLSDKEALRKARVHPMQILLAETTYRAGKGVRGSLEWKPVPQIVDALDDAFYSTFDLIEPAGKRTLIALDVSPSMRSSMIAGTFLSAREASAAMSMVVARTEPKYDFVAFAKQIVPVTLTAKMALPDVVRAITGLNWAATDCAQPMIYALNNGIEVDTFIIYTDSETWIGRIHPFQALRQYRDKTGINARLIVCGMTATNITIADPNDAGMMDVVGMDSSAPSVIADFSAGRV